jgi:hypothetical protein
VSTFLSQARAKALRPPPPARPGLTVVPKPAVTTPRVPFVLLVVTLLGAGLVGLLILNTSLERGAYVSGSLRAQATDLAQRQQDLELKVAALQQPQRVAERAEQLGMVQNTNPAFLVLPTGKVLGHPRPGVAADRVDIGAGLVSARERAKAVDIPAGAQASLSSGDVAVPQSPGAGGDSPTAGNTGAASAG